MKSKQLISVLICIISILAFRVVLDSRDFQKYQIVTAGSNGTLVLILDTYTGKVELLTWYENSSKDSLKLWPLKYTYE